MNTRDEIDRPVDVLAEGTHANQSSLRSNRHLRTLLPWRTGVNFPTPDVPRVNLPGNSAPQELPLPELAEVDVVRPLCEPVKIH